MQHLMHHVTVSLQQSKITLQNNCMYCIYLLTGPIVVFDWQDVIYCKGR